MAHKAHRGGRGRCAKNRPGSGRRPRIPPLTRHKRHAIEDNTELNQSPWRQETAVTATHEFATASDYAAAVGQKDQRLNRFGPPESVPGAVRGPADWQVSSRRGKKSSVAGGRSLHAVPRSRMRFSTSTGSKMATGTVKWFNDAKGFGFITPDEGGEDLFAHFSEIKTEGFKSLQENQKVSFDVKMGPKGKQAANIKPV